MPSTMAMQARMIGCMRVREYAELSERDVHALYLVES